LLLKKKKKKLSGGFGPGQGVVGAAAIPDFLTLNFFYFIFIHSCGIPCQHQYQSVNNNLLWLVLLSQILDGNT